MSVPDNIPIRLYRPGSGMEGACFYEEWCACCVRDRGFPDDDKEDGWCKIAADVYTYEITDSRYPRQWIIVADQPQCTAFIEDVGQKWPPDATTEELEAAGQGKLL